MEEEQIHLWVQWAGPEPRWKLRVAFKSVKGKLPDRTACTQIGHWVSCHWERLAWTVQPPRRKAEESFQALDGALEEMTTRVPTNSELWHSVTNVIALPLVHSGEEMDLLILS